MVPELIFRYDGGLTARLSNVFSYTLSWLRAISLSLPGSIAVTILVAAVLCGAFRACRCLYGARLKRAALVLFAAVTLANNVCAYIYMARNNVFSEDAVRATEEIRTAIGSEECVDVFADAATRFDSLLDVSTKDSRSIVFINDLNNRTVGTGGVYEPFVPDEIRGDIPCRPTADAELLLLDRDALTHVELSPDTTVVAQNDLMTLIRIVPGKRWADSMLGGPVGTSLSAGTKAFFVSFDGSAHRALFADISSQTGEAGAEVTVTTGSGNSFSFTLSEGRNTYEIITGGDGTVGICSDSDISIYSYRFD